MVVDIKFINVWLITATNHSEISDNFYCVSDVSLTESTRLSKLDANLMFMILQTLQLHTFVFFVSTVLTLALRFPTVGGQGIVRAVPVLVAKQTSP